MPKRRPKQNFDREEREIIARIDLMRRCRPEMKRWLALVRSKTFSLDIQAQNQAALLARGLAMKVESLKLIECHKGNQLNSFLNLLYSIANTYGAVWDKKSIHLVVSSPDGGPIEHEVSHRYDMDIGRLRATIAKARGKQ